jgi:large subunit ribosomal protein L9
MEIILLERIAKLGQMGDTVRVKDGYARNFLLPAGKALRATETNKQRFENERSQLEARNLEAKNEAEAVAEKLSGQSFVAIRSAGETGQLYGSVSTRDIAETLSDGGFSTQRQQVRLDRPIKTIGLMEILITLHPEVEVPITLNVARSTDEAERQARGEDLTQREAFEEEIEEEAAPDLEEVFEKQEDVEQAAAEEAGEEEETAAEATAEAEEPASDEEDESTS